MAGLQDMSAGFKKESTYGTGVTPDRWPEFTDDSDGFDIDGFERVQGKGMRVGSRVARSGRRVTTKRAAAGSFGYELFSKGQGALWELVLGSGASTLVSGTTYQQVFTLADTQPSATWQQGIVDASGTVNPFTFPGTVVTKAEFSCDDSIAMAKIDLDARDITTATAYAAPTMPTGGNLFSFATSVITLGGTVTAPTTTALASGGTAVTNVESWSCEIDRALAVERFTHGNGGLKSKPLVTGGQAITGKLTLEYVDNVVRDAIINDTALPLTITMSGGALSAGNETWQLVLPEVKLDAKGLPKQGGGDLPKLDVTWTALDNLVAAQPIWLVCRTSDSAL